MTKSTHGLFSLIAVISCFQFACGGDPSSNANAESEFEQCDLLCSPSADDSNAQFCSPEKRSVCTKECNLLFKAVSDNEQCMQCLYDKSDRISGWSHVTEPENDKDSDSEQPLCSKDMLYNKNSGDCEPKTGCSYNITRINNSSCETFCATIPQTEKESASSKTLFD